MDDLDLLSLCRRQLPPSRSTSPAIAADPASLRHTVPSAKCTTYLPSSSHPSPPTPLFRPRVQSATAPCRRRRSITIVIRLLQPLQRSGIPAGRQQRANHILSALHKVRHIVCLVQHPLAIIRPSWSHATSLLTRLPFRNISYVPSAVAYSRADLIPGSPATGPCRWGG